MKLFSWLCEVAEGAQLASLAQAIVTLFDQNKLIPRLLDAVIDIEVERSCKCQRSYGHLG